MLFLRNLGSKILKYRALIMIITLVCMIILMIKHSVLWVTTFKELDAILCESEMSDLPMMRDCPVKPIVTVHELGGLGNIMWEYASVYAFAKATDREGFVPTCIARRLSAVFDNLTLPALSDAGYCSISLPSYVRKTDDPGLKAGNIELGNYIQLTSYVMPILSEIIGMFHFNSELKEHSLRILRNVTERNNVTVFVGVHVRRTDYEFYLKRKFSAKMVNAEYFLRNMEYFRNKFNSVVFIVVSDDPDWCDDNLRVSDVVITRNNTPEQDLALLASCNHTLMDYGTFGMWGAMFAGGETLLYDLKHKCLETDVTSLMPKWRLIS